MASNDNTLQSPGFEPNYTTCHTIVLDHPLSVTFPRLAHGDTMESSVRLSDLVTAFDLIKSDSVAIPSCLHLSETSIRTLQGSTTAEAGKRHLPRQSFRHEETVPLLFGLFNYRVTVSGTLTWDEDANMALYESLEENQGILTWKLREFEEFEEDGVKKTRVKEKIEGHTPMLLRLLVEKTTRDAHISHMEKYHTLFK